MDVLLDRERLGPPGGGQGAPGLGLSGLVRKGTDTDDLLHASYSVNSFNAIGEVI